MCRCLKPPRAAVVMLLFAASLICLRPTSVHGAKIVLFYPIAPASHALTVSVLTDELIRRGHSVHVVRWKEAGKPESVGYGVPVTNPANNFTTKVTTLAMDGRDGRFFVLTKEKEAGFIYPTKMMWEPGLSSYAVLLRPEWAKYFSFLESYCDTLLSNQPLIQKFRAERFDLAIVDMTWNECSVALARSLKIKPVVGFWLSAASSIEPDLSTTILTSSHLSIFRAKRSPTTMLDRLQNIFARVTSQLVMRIYYYHIDQSIAKYLPHLQTSAQELEKGIDGMLINDHLALGTPKALPPNYVNVGGLQINGGHPPALPQVRQAVAVLYQAIRGPNETLSQDLEDWLSDAPHGVLFFSFGTRLGIGGAPGWIRQAFLQALQRLPQKVLVQLQPPLEFEWRINGSMPANIRTFEWVSQQGVLAHPNVRAFITHGGLQSVLESIYAGVPMVVFPVVHDAPETSSKMVAKGIAVELDRYKVTSESVVAAVNQVLRQPSFKRNIQALSKVMRQETQPPLHRAVEFLEHLLAHNGAPHLKIPNESLSLAQYLYLDILGTLIFLASCIYVAIRGLWGIARLCNYSCLYISASVRLALKFEDENSNTITKEKYQ